MRDFLASSWFRYCHDNQYYNNGLRQSGDFSIFTEETVADWHPVKTGRPQEYSDIEFRNSGAVWH
jgi:hypothetical protein